MQPVEYDPNQKLEKSSYLRTYFNSLHEEFEEFIAPVTVIKILF